MEEHYWLIAESNSGRTYYYSGYYENGIPIFNMAIACAIHIASFENAKEIFKILNKLIPCEIWEVKGKKVTQIL